MATSGSFTGKMAQPGVRVQLLWEQTKNQSNGTSTITFKLQMANDTTAYIGSAGSWEVHVGSADKGISTNNTNLSANKAWADVGNSVNFTVPHNSDGTKTISVSVVDHGTSNPAPIKISKLSKDVVLDPLHTACSIGSITPGTIDFDSSAAISILNGNEGVYLKLTMALGEASVSYNLPGNSIQATFTLPTAWQAQMGTETRKQGTATLATYSDSARTQMIGTPHAMVWYANVSGSAVTVDAGWVMLYPYQPSEISTWTSIFVARHSKVRAVFDVNKIHCPSGVTIQEYSITYEGIKHYSSNSNFVSGSVINGSGYVPVTVAIKDSQLQTISDTITLNVAEYLPPVLTDVEILRWDNAAGEAVDGAPWIRVRANATYTQIGDNSVSIAAQYRVAGTSWGDTWTPLTVPSGGTIPDALLGGGALDSSTTYEARIRAVDALSTVYRTGTAPSEAVTFNALDGNAGVAFGRMASSNKAGWIDSRWSIHTDGVVEASQGFVGFDVRVGTISLTNGSGVTTQSVLFNEAMDGTPVVVLSNAYGVRALVQNVTDSGFDVQYDQSSVFATLSIGYIAIYWGIGNA